MSKKTKKKMSKKERSQKHSDWINSIKREIVSKKENVLIPEEVTLTKDDNDSSKEYLISFVNYLDNECEMNKMITNKDRDLGYALKILKTVSGECEHYRQLKEKNFTIKPVHNNSQYSKLYKGLENMGIDIRGLLIYEAYIKTSSDGRMFFWSDEPNKKIYVITVRKNHYK